jgi:hypothetical protein
MHRSCARAIWAVAMQVVLQPKTSCTVSLYANIVALILCLSLCNTELGKGGGGGGAAVNAPGSSSSSSANPLAASTAAAAAAVLSSSSGSTSSTNSSSRAAGGASRSPPRPLSSGLSATAPLSKSAPLIEVDDESAAAADDSSGSKAGNKSPRSRKAWAGFKKTFS